MAVELIGKAVVVTGAGQGLGRAYALEAARRGAAVMVNDCDGASADRVAAEITAAGGVALACAGSVDDADTVDAVVASARERFGRLDGMVINAGVYHEALPWAEDPNAVERAVRVNVLGGILCLVAAARAMAAAGRGSVVIASSAGALGSRAIMTYAASKGALASLTYAAALDLADRGVRVNAVAPVAATRMTQGAIGGRIVPDGAEVPLLNALGAPDRVAPLVAYLLSDAADGITGQFIRFDGRRLGLLPQPSLPDLDTLEAPTWTAETIADAFAGPLADRLEPFGVERILPQRTLTRPEPD